MNELPIKVGSIVRVKNAWWNEIGIVTHANIWNPGGYRIAIPGPVQGTVERSDARCYHATEQEKAKYFKLVLKYGR